MHSKADKIDMRLYSYGSPFNLPLFAYPQEEIYAIRQKFYSPQSHGISPSESTRRDRANCQFIIWLKTFKLSCMISIRAQKYSYVSISGLFAAQTTCTALSILSGAVLSQYRRSLTLIILTLGRLHPRSSCKRRQTHLDLLYESLKTQEWHFTNFNGITSLIFQLWEKKWCLGL